MIKRSGFSIVNSERGYYFDAKFKPMSRKDFKGAIYCADIVSAYRSLVECSFDSLTKINKEPLKKALNKCKLLGISESSEVAKAIVKELNKEQCDTEDFLYDLCVYILRENRKTYGMTRRISRSVQGRW